MPSGSPNVTSAEVVMLVGGCPASDRPCDSAIEKQPEWAAAMSSSGLVRPLGASARDSQVSSKLPSPDESRLTDPLPVASGPSQRVVAVRTVATMTSPFTARTCADQGRLLRAGRYLSWTPGPPRVTTGPEGGPAAGHGRAEPARGAGWAGPHKARPPSTGTMAPVMPLAPSPARNAMTAATSSGRSSRPSGCSLANDSAAGSEYSRALSSRTGVAVDPGLTAFAVTPVPPSSAASARMKPATAALDAQYAASIGRPRVAA